jgi:serine/threonine-protein kinase RsbW
VIVKERILPLERKNLIPVFYQVISSRVLEIDLLLDKIMHVAKQLPFTASQEEDIRLAVYEALANAVVHGNASDLQKEVDVACFFESNSCETLVIVVRDEGAGFDPDSIPDPRFGQGKYSSHGRGIYFMRQLMDEVAYFNGGREVELRKRLCPQSE